MHTLTDQQQLDNALELIKAKGFIVTENPPEVKQGAWEPKEGEKSWILGSQGIEPGTMGLQCGTSAFDRGNIFPHIPEGFAQALATDKRRRLIAEAEREGMPKRAEWFQCLRDGRVRQYAWDDSYTDFALFRSGNYSRTKAGLEDKIARYGAECVEGKV